MTLTTKILIFLGAILIICSATFIIYKQIEITQQQTAIQNSLIEQKQLADNITRSMSQLVSKQDFDKFAADSNVNLDTIKKDLDTLNANLVAINKVTVNSKGQTQSGVASSTTTPNPVPTTPDPSNPDLFGYMKNRQTLNLSEDFDTLKVPFGDVSFDAWKDKPWSYNVYPRTYSVVNTIATDENQRHYVYNKVSINVNNKPYDLKIAQSQTVETLPEDKFRFFNPKLFLSASGGIQMTSVPIKGDATIGANVGIIDYGKFKNNPALSIMQVGASYQVESKRPAAVLNPINVNVGSITNTSVLSNTYVGPTVQLNTDLQVLVGLSAGVSF